MGMKVIYRNKSGRIEEETLNVNYIEVSAVDEEITIFLAPQDSGYKTYQLDDIIQIQAL